VSLAAQRRKVGSVNTVEYILRPQGPWIRRSEDGSLVFIAFDLRVERRGELLGGKHLQATVRSPDVPDDHHMKAAADAVLTLPSSGWLVILRGWFAEQPSIATSIFESAAADLEALIAWGKAQPPETHERCSSEKDAFTERFWASSIRAVGPDYWR
jgi:hypothetical protein